MKKLAIATAATLIAGSAAAQSSVTLYGLVDNALEYRTHAGATGPAGANGSKFMMTSGGMNTSRFGMEGSEELGAGLSAIFKLEGELDTATGAGGSKLFGRQANVGFKGGFGKIIFGRAYATSYDFMLPTDPMGYAPNYSWVTSAGATGGRKDPMKTSADNIIKYEGNFNGVRVGATYSIGGVVDDYERNSMYALGLGYKNGPFYGAVTYDRTNSNTANIDKASSINAGVSYAIKPVKLFLGGRYYKKTFALGGPDLRSNLYWGGVQVMATKALRLTGAAYYQDISNVPSGTDADPMMFVLQAKYSLSKRTSIYASGAYTKAKNSQLVGVSRDDAGFATNQTGISLGLQHRF